MYTPSDRHGYCDTCTHIRAVHGTTGDPRHEPCECCEPTGDTMKTYPTDIVTDDGGWQRIHRGHGIDRATLSDDLTHALGEPPPGHTLSIMETHFHYRPRIKWCDPACDNEGEWHAHWEEVRPNPDAAFTLARWARVEDAPVPDVTFDNPVTVQGQPR